MSTAGTGDSVFELCFKEEYTTKFQSGLLHAHKFLRGILERHDCEQGKCSYVLRTYRRVRARSSREIDDAYKVLTPC
jgi:hypothetical protein